MSSPASVKKNLRGGEFLLREVTPEMIFTRDDLEGIQYEVAAAMRAFYEKEVVPRDEEIESLTVATLRELMLKAGEVGLLGMEVPTSMGGYGMKKTTALLAAEAQSLQLSFSGCVGVHTSVGMIPIVYFGSPAQREKYLPKLLTGEWIAAYCLTEPHCGSDAMAIRTTATLSEDGQYYLINGSKMWITNAGFANLFNVAAKVDGKKFTMFIVEADTPGVTLGAEEKKMGITGSSTRPVFFDNVRVPVENVLGEIGKGHHIAFNALNMGRMNIGAGASSQIKRSVNFSVKYAKMRKAFGKTIADFGLIKHKLAEMAGRAYTVESMAFRIVGAFDEQLQGLDSNDSNYLAHSMEALREYAIESSLMKIYGSEAQNYAVDEAVQIFGGNGYSKEYPVERDYRNSRPTRIFEGTNEINRLLIVDMLIKRAMDGSLPLMAAAQTAIAAFQSKATAALPPAIPTLDDDFTVESQLIANMKQVSLVLLWQAAQKWTINLAEEQEVVAAISDCIADTYAAESVLLRTQKRARRSVAPDAPTASYHIDMLRVMLNDTATRFSNNARQLFGVISSEADLVGNLTALQHFLAWPAYNTIAARRRIADRLIDAEQYCFE
jgi:alkylation response protein AidB-like acyl-CoA dehydrogenase